MEEITTDTTDATDDKTSRLPVWSKYVLIALAASAMIAYLWVSGWGGYAYAYVKCGVKQPLITSSFETGKIYYTPDNRRYSAPGEGAFFSGYYCTESQAKADGFLRVSP